MRRPWSKKYASESELCREFMVAARSAGFRVYPETAEFDILLVAGEDCPDCFRPGDQIGVQAKLHANLAVLHQALPRQLRHPGPHYYAVLVPKWSEALRDVAKRLDITPLIGSHFANPHVGIVREFRRVPWYRQDPGTLCWVPECEVDMEAGVQSPRSLTPWKLGSVKLCLLAEQRGYLTTADFRQHGVSMVYWRKRNWLVTGKMAVEDGKRYRRYHLNLEAQPPHHLYTEVADALQKASGA